MSVLPVDSLETPRFCGVPTFMRLPQATPRKNLDAAIIGLPSMPVARLKVPNTNMPNDQTHHKKGTET